MFMSKALLQSSVLAIGVAVAAPVFAIHAIPVNTTFTASGPTALTQSGTTIGCISTFTLVSDGSGNVVVTQATFAGGSLVCQKLSSSGLPWPVSFNSTTEATINNVSVQSPLGMCSGNVIANIDNNNSRIIFGGLLGPCVVSGDLTVAPKFSVVN